MVDEKKEQIAVIRDIYKKEAMVTAAITENFCCAVGSSRWMFSSSVNDVK
jgi:hypothetical protein